MAYKILIVDDDVGSQKLVTKILEKQGYEAFIANDGLEALAKIEQDIPDLVVLDVMMPEINGYDVCYQLRFNEKFKKIPIIMLTARGQELPEDIGKRVNIDYMQKPMDPKMFVEKVKRFLK